MKKILVALVAVILSVGLVSCQKDLLDPNQNGQHSGRNGKAGEVQTIEITAVFSHSKVSYTETVDAQSGELALQPAWEAGDVVFGFDDEGNTYSFSVCNITEDHAVLRGEAPQNATMHLIHAKGYSEEDLEIAGSKSERGRTKAGAAGNGSTVLTVNYANQKGDKSMPAVMVADGEIKDFKGEFEFSNAGAVVGIDNVNGVPQGTAINSVSIFSDSEDFDLTKGVITLEGGKLTLSAKGLNGSTSGTIIVNPTDISVVDDNGTLSSPIFVAVPKNTSIDFVNVVADGKEYGYALEASRTAEANDYLYVKTQEFTVFPDYFCITNISDNEGVATWIQEQEEGRITITPELVYSPDKRHWYNVAFGENISVPAGTNLYFAAKSENNAFSIGGGGSVDAPPFKVCHLSTNFDFSASGNIMSLLYSNGFDNVNELYSRNRAAFAYLFSGCSGLKDISRLRLPVTIFDRCSWDEWSYAFLFENCTGITYIPEDFLPATAVGGHCYHGMFKGCSGITSIPENLLHATTIFDNGCYELMFSGCTGLKELPENLLPATKLEWLCYKGMFSGCTGLTSIPEKFLPAKGLIYACYESMFSGCSSLQSIPENLLHASIADWCYMEMFENCTGLTSIPEGLLPSKKLYRYCYYGMFRGCTGLTSIPESLLPATDLSTAGDCYREMFKDCTGITSIPENLLPATILAENCYSGMFYGCSGITAVPQKLLPAISLEENCYNNMFCKCSKLSTLPNGFLPATTLASYCYANMFSNCSKLNTVPSNLLPASTLEPYCYEYMFSHCSSISSLPESFLPAINLANNCYQSMFWGDTRLSSVPSNLLPATVLAPECYSTMFCGTSLEIAPDLPAKILEQSCYYLMFADNRSIRYVKCLATDISAYSCLSSWLNYCPRTGTFIKAGGVEWPRGGSGIPEGWTVEEQ